MYREVIYDTCVGACDGWDCDDCDCLEPRVHDTDRALALVSCAGAGLISCGGGCRRCGWVCGCGGCGGCVGVIMLLLLLLLFRCCDLALEPVLTVALLVVSYTSWCLLDLGVPTSDSDITVVASNKSSTLGGN